MNSPMTTISSGNGIADNNPYNIVCPLKSSPEAEGEPWYLQDDVPGYWDANFINPIQPTVFRISNTHTDRGTLSFNILALGSNEYFDLSYVDPNTQQIIQCSTDCILSNDTYQDFTVLQPKSTNGIRININSWYGLSGGLGYVQIFQSDISVNPHLYANTDTQCNPSASSTQTSVIGDWKDVYVYGYYQTILQANVPYSTLSTSNTAITYQPNIPAQGQYDIYATTPGCVGSSNCFERTQVEYELDLTPGFPPIKITLDQNVFEDRKTLIYSGTISPITSSFRPKVILRPAPNASPPSSGGSNVSIMADTIEFIRNTTASTLVSILEYNPSIQPSKDIRPWKPLNQQLPLGSTVYTIDATKGDLLYIGGLFTGIGNNFKNIVSYDNNQGSLIPLDNQPQSGVNGKVSKVLLQDNILYVGGEFNGTQTINASYIVQYDTSKKIWSSLGKGLDGDVSQLVFSTDNRILTVSGNFRHRATSEADIRISIGNALWNITSQNWAERSSLIVGELTTDLNLNNNQKYFAGSIIGAQTYRADLVTSNDIKSSHTFFNRSMIITAGVTWMNNLTSPVTPITIIAGYPYETIHRNITTTIYIYNNRTDTLSLIDHVHGNVHSLAVLDNKLFVGGHFYPAQNRNQSASLTLYDLANKNRILGINGLHDENNNPGTVHVMKPHPDGKRMIVGGRFTSVGLLDCNAVCLIDPAMRQWNKIGVDISGTVFDIVTSVHQDIQKITVIGNLSQSTSSIASLIGRDTTWIYHKTSDLLPGTPTMALNSIDDELIIAGTRSSNPSEFFLGTFNDGKYTDIKAEFEQGTNVTQILLVPVSTSIEQRFPTGTQNMLLAVGYLNMTKYGQASAALYDGTTWYPYLLTTQMNGLPGTIHQIIHTTNFDGVRGARKYLPVAAVILISIAISTGIIFAMSAIVLFVLFKKHQKVKGAEDMPPWTPNQRFLETVGFGTLGAAAIAATAPNKGSNSNDSALFAASTSRKPSRSAVQRDDLGDLGLSPTTTIVNPLPKAIVPFSALVATAQANQDGPTSEAQPKVYYAKYPFKAQEFGELSFNAGDTIVVTDTTDNVWWLGYKDDGSNKPISGVFPSNYVKDSI